MSCGGKLKIFVTPKKFKFNLQHACKLGKVQDHKWSTLSSECQQIVADYYCCNYCGLEDILKENDLGVFHIDCASKVTFLSDVH